jgi:hypothetical protein
LVGEPQVREALALSRADLREVSRWKWHDSAPCLGER